MRKFIPTPKGSCVLYQKNHIKTQVGKEQDSGFLGSSTKEEAVVDRNARLTQIKESCAHLLWHLQGRQGIILLSLLHAEVEFQLCLYSSSSCFFMCLMSYCHLKSLPQGVTFYYVNEVKVCMDYFSE